MGHHEGFDERGGHSHENAFYGAYAHENDGRPGYWDRPGEFDPNHAVVRPTCVRLRAAPPYNGLTGSVFSYSHITSSFSVKLDNGNHVVATSGKCLDAEENQHLNNLIPAENQRFHYG
jgi:hypothetical protein